MLVDATILIPASLLLLRLIVAAVFFSSGRKHAQNPVDRGDSIGMSPEFTRILGVAEMAAAISIAFGVFPQIGALIIMVTMIGAIQKKIAVWNMGFYADEGLGWHYDVIFLIAALVIFATNGGTYVIF